MHAKYKTETKHSIVMMYIERIFFSQRTTQESNKKNHQKHIICVKRTLF
jgi:hypothetical protein